MVHVLQVAYHTPPRFPIDVIHHIREGASILFKRLGLRDFARIDGWFLPSSALGSSISDDKFGKSEFGTILFTDINLVRHISSFIELLSYHGFVFIMLMFFMCHYHRLAGWSKPVFSFSKPPRCTSLLLFFVLKATRPIHIFN